MTIEGFMSRLANCMTTLVAIMALVLAGSVSAIAATDWNPPPVTINDPAGTTQDWYMWSVDGQSYYSYDPAGQSVIPPGEHISSGGVLDLTVYVVRYLDGETRAVPLSFTNAAGTRAPNTVTLHADQMVCGKFSTQSTWLPVTWNETYDGTGLTSNTPGVMFKGDDGSLSPLQVNSTSSASTNHIIPDGGSVRLDAYNPNWGLLPGWYTAVPYRVPDDNSAIVYEPASAHSRLWVPTCGGAAVPPGQIPPGGTVPTPPNNPGGSTGKATGKLKLLRSAGRVKATAINRKVTSRSDFRLKANGKVVKTITAPAGKVVKWTVRANVRTRYVLQVRSVVGGRDRYRPVARLLVSR